MRLIDADELLTQMRSCIEAVKTVNATFNFLWGYTSALHAMEDALENAPTFVPKNVRLRGQWKQARYTEAPLYICSECDKQAYKQHNYCPYCGARMFGVVKGYLTDQGKFAALRKDFKTIKKGD